VEADLMDLGLRGKHALVTGGSHGIGLATARRLVAEGCHVWVLSRKPFVWGKFLLTDDSGSVDFVGCDVLQPQQIEEAMQIIEQRGPLHILINNVGGGGRWGTEQPEEADTDVWADVYTKNAGAAIKFTMLALPMMRRQRWGRVVTVASMHGREGGGRPWFAMAKSAEIALMKSLAGMKDLARANITFNSVAPGPIMIPDTGWAKMEREQPEAFKDYVDKLPLGRLGMPIEIANIITFLCSERASLINGACIAIDGGQGKAF